MVRGDRRRPSAVRPSGARRARRAVAARGHAPRFTLSFAPSSPAPPPARAFSPPTHAAPPQSLCSGSVGDSRRGLTVAPGPARGRGILLPGVTDELDDARCFASSTDGSPRGTTAEARLKRCASGLPTRRPAPGLAASCPRSSTPSHSPEPKLGARHMVSEDQTEKICYSIQVGVIPCLADDNFPPRSLRPLMAPPNPEPQPFPHDTASEPPAPPHSRAVRVARGAYGRCVVVSLWCRSVSSTPLALLAVLCDTIPYCQ